MTETDGLLEMLTKPKKKILSFINDHLRRFSRSLSFSSFCWQFVLTNYQKGYCVNWELEKEIWETVMGQVPEKVQKKEKKK
jgi:isocitrate lyase